MKRSEMLDRMEAYVSMYQTGSFEVSFEEFLLKGLEDLGMMPPSKKMTYKDLDAVRGYCHNPFLEFHSWEDEDV